MLQFIDNFLLKNITSVNLGGPAKKFIVIKTKEELIEALEFAKQISLPYLIIGGGSNLLVADEGINALVIKNEITGINIQNQEVKVSSGTLLQNLVNNTINKGLSGLEKLTGIPGTVGGAIYGNAGAYDQTISDNLIKVIVINENNDLVVFTKEQCQFDYRDSIFKKNHFIILEAYFLLQTGDLKNLQQEAKDIISKREVKYPPGIKCPGSFFKNLLANKLPPEILQNIPQEKIVYGKVPAGTLLESVGAKGQKLDGIEIASYHANLFINTGKGTAQAFCKLAKTYQQKVKEKFNIVLEPEVQLINLPPL